MIKCSACDGHGERPMSAELYEVFQHVPFGSWRSTTAILALIPHSRTKPSPTAAANRLVKLEALGVVTRQRVGRAAEWRRI